MKRTDLSDTTLVVTDTETTGTRPGVDRVIEIAAVKIQGGRIIDRFSELVNPGRAVPGFIARMTGITTGMLYGRPPVEEVLPRYLDFLGDAVFVAHNARFDQGFLDAELVRSGLSPIASPILCTMRLARRLLRGLPSKGLASIADFYGITIQGRHRALGDAEATAEVLLRFVEQLRTMHGLSTVDDLLGFQFSLYGKPSQESRPLRKIREEVLPALPTGPGVYFMKNGRGSILYIGKATNLRSRVRSYFTGLERHEARLREMVSRVRQITVVETPCELSALLLESRLIKEKQPAYNRASRRYRRRPFIRIDTAQAYPRVTVSSYVLNDGAEYFGPLSGRAQAELVVEFINRVFHLRQCDDTTFRRKERCLYASMDRCDAPCTDSTSATAYAAEVQRVRDFLTGRDRTALDSLQTGMKQAAARLDFEEAATFRDLLHRLEHLMAKQESIAAPVMAHNAALLLPQPGGSAVQVFIVRYGRHVETLTLSAALPMDDELRLQERLACHFGSSESEPERYLKQEVDEISLLAHWMYVHRAGLRKVTWAPDEGLDAFTRAILAAAFAPWSDEAVALEDDEDEEEGESA